jgi:hypothetical protein
VIWSRLLDDHLRRDVLLSYLRHGLRRHDSFLVLPLLRDHRRRLYHRRLRLYHHVLLLTGLLQ